MKSKRKRKFSFAFPNDSTFVVQRLPPSYSVQSAINMWLFDVKISQYCLFFSVSFIDISPLIYLACVCARTRARDVIILLPSTTFCSNMQRFKSIWCGRCLVIDHRLTTVRPSLEQLSNRQLGHGE